MGAEKTFFEFWFYKFMNFLLKKAGDLTRVQLCNYVDMQGIPSDRQHYFSPIQRKIEKI